MYLTFAACVFLELQCLAAEPSARLPELRGMASRAIAAWDDVAEATAKFDSWSAHGIDLLAPEGVAFVGQQLRFLDQSEPGVLRATRPVWIYLYLTEGRDFTLSGEVHLGAHETADGELRDGFALFLREWDSGHRYEATFRRALAKGRLAQGRSSQFAESPTELPSPRRGEWLPFRASVGQSGIEFAANGNMLRIEGPLDVDGGNKVAIAPGTKLRNLRLAFGVSSNAAASKASRPKTEAPSGLPGQAAVVRVENGGFDDAPAAPGGDETGQFGETMFAPGSKLLRGWSVAEGLVGFRREPPSPAGGNVLELGPRDVPGAISQVVRTRPGQRYRLSFFASAGRSGANERLSVSAGGQKHGFRCPNRGYERLALDFQAEKSETEIVIQGLGSSGFGPMIDDVKLEEIQ